MNSVRCPNLSWPALSYSKTIGGLKTLIRNSCSAFVAITRHGQRLHVSCPVNTNARLSVCEKRLLISSSKGRSYYRILKTALGEGIRPKTGPRITPTFLLIRFQKTLEIGFGGFFGLVLCVKGILELSNPRADLFLIFGSGVDLDHLIATRHAFHKSPCFSLP